MNDENVNENEDLNLEEIEARLEEIEKWVTELTEETIEMLGDDLEFFLPFGGKEKMLAWSHFMLLSGMRTGVHPSLILLSGITAGIALEKRRAAQVAELNALTGE